MGNDLSKKIEKMKAGNLNEQINQQFETWKNFIKEQQKEINNLRGELSARMQELNSVRTLAANSTDELEKTKRIYEEEKLNLRELLDTSRRESDKIISDLKTFVEQEKEEFSGRLKSKDEEIIAIKAGSEDRLNSYKKNMDVETIKFTGMVKKLQEEKTDMERDLMNKEEKFLEEKVSLEREVGELKNKITRLEQIIKNLVPRPE